MSTDLLRNNLKQIKEIVRELYIFSMQLDSINNLETTKQVVVNKEEKNLLENSIASLTNQLKILNNTLPDLVNMIAFYKPMPNQSGFAPGQKTVPAQMSQVQQKPLTKIQYKSGDKDQVSFVISEKDRSNFLDNLSQSRLSINQLKKKYSVEKKSSPLVVSNQYSRISNKFFGGVSKDLIAKGYFKELNRSLRKINSRFVLRNYVSMIFFTSFLAFIGCLFLSVFLLFFNVSMVFPNFITLAEGSILRRFFKLFLIPLVAPFVTGAFVYFYPASEAKNLGSKINQELPFVAIHMSAIASSGLEPVSIFKIILRGGEYRYTNIEIKKLMNLINFHGEDLVSALKKIGFSSPSSRFKELFNGLAITMTSGGDIHQFLSKHAETLLFDYRLEREKYTRVSETFMDIYISIAIAAPMVFLMLFVIMGSTGLMSGFIGMNVNVMSILMILGIIILNVFFLIFLKMKQPVM